MYTSAYRTLWYSLPSALCLIWTLSLCWSGDCIHRTSYRNTIAHHLNNRPSCQISLNKDLIGEGGTFIARSSCLSPRNLCRGIRNFCGTTAPYHDRTVIGSKGDAAFLLSWKPDSGWKFRREHIDECPAFFDKLMGGEERGDEHSITGNGMPNTSSEIYQTGGALDQCGSNNNGTAINPAETSKANKNNSGEVMEEAKPGEITEEDIMKMKVALSQSATLGIDFVKCIETLQTSPYCTVSPTTIAYNATLSAAERNSNAQLTLAVIEDMRKKGNVLDGVSYKLAITTCAKCGYTENALNLYDEMLKNGHSPDHGVMRALMAQLAKEGNGLECLRIYEDMKKLEKVRQTEETFMQPDDHLKLIEACTKAQMYDEALQAYKEMKAHKRYTLTSPVITQVLTLCYGAGYWQEAMELYSILLREKMSLTVYQYKLLLSVMFIFRKYMQMESIYNSMEREGTAMDFMAYQLVLEGYAKTGQFQKALKLLEKMENDGFLYGKYEPFIAAAEACRQSGEWKLALKLLRKANDINTDRSITMYNTVLSVFVAAEEWDAIISIYNEIEVACKELKGSVNKLNMDGDTVAYGIMAYFYTGDKAQVDRLLQLPVIETTLLLKLRKSIQAEENVISPKDVEGTQR